MRAGKTVLIVGGEEEARISLAESLMAERYQVLEADDRKEREALQRSHRPDLVLMMGITAEEDDPAILAVGSAPRVAQTVGAVRARIGAAFPSARPTRRRLPRIRLPRRPART